MQCNRAQQDSRGLKKEAEEGSRKVGRNGERSLLRPNESCTADSLWSRSERRDRAGDTFFERIPEEEAGRTRSMLAKLTEGAENERGRPLVSGRAAQHNEPIFGSFGVMGYRL